MGSSASSLMVVLEGEEYCFLYDEPSFPELLETLLETKRRPENTPHGLLNVDQAREVARSLIGKTYSEI